MSGTQDGCRNTSNLLLPPGQAREASWFSVRTVLLGMESSDAPDRTAPLAAAGLWCRGRSGAPAPRPGRGRGHKECALMMPGPARRGQKLSREIPSLGFRGPHGMGFNFSILRTSCILASKLLLRSSFMFCCPEKASPVIV